MVLPGADAAAKRYVPKLLADEQLLTDRIIGLAPQTGRYGYRRVTVLVRMKGGSVNPKRVHRIW